MRDLDDRLINKGRVSSQPSERILRADLKLPHDHSCGLVHFPRLKQPGPVAPAPWRVHILQHLPHHPTSQQVMNPLRAG